MVSHLHECERMFLNASWLSTEIPQTTVTILLIVYFIMFYGVAYYCLYPVCLLFT